MFNRAWLENYCADTCLLCDQLATHRIFFNRFASQSSSRILCAIHYQKVIEQEDDDFLKYLENSIEKCFICKAPVRQDYICSKCLLNY